MRSFSSKTRKHVKRRISIILLALVCCFGCFFSGSQNAQISASNIPNIIEQQPSEDDWSLPSWVTRTENSGLYAEYTDIFKPEAYTVTMTWKEINPSENVFNWRGLEDKLEEARKRNKRIWLRIFASDVKHTPDWVKAKYPDLRTMQYKNEGGSYLDIHDYKTSEGKFYPIWHPGFEAEFKKLMANFKQRRYIADPALAFMYAPGAWRWNEWEVIFVDEMKRSGVSPAQFLQWFRRHLDDYADAASGYTYKLVFTGQPQMERCENDGFWALTLNDVPQGKNRLVDHAVALGMSVRIGAQEYFNPYSNIPSWGAAAATIGNLNYQFIDDFHPLHRDRNRIIGTENELLGYDNMLPGTGKYYFMKMATLKSLQLRMNWINATDTSYSLAPQVVEYARKTMGKTVENSPDAWAALRQWNDPTYLGDRIPPYSDAMGITRSDHQKIDTLFKNAQLPYRNWERWLIQREVAPDGYTQPAQQVYDRTNFIKWNGFSYEAIRTDRQNQSNYIYFNVDDRFLLNKRTDVEIKVTYLDDNNATWELEYDALNGNLYKKTSQVFNQNSGKWKTVTFRISDAAFANRQNGNMDFRIYNGGSQDLTVRFVRVIKLQPV
jgi:Beta-galactosidase